MGIGRRSYLLVGHGVDAEDIGYFGLAEPAQLTLQLETGEGLGHLPALDVARAAGRHVTRKVAGEHDVVYVLAMGLAL